MKLRVRQTPAEDRERLIMELKDTFTVDDDADNHLIEYYQGSINPDGNMAFCLFRVFANELWEFSKVGPGVVGLLLDHQSGSGFEMKVCKRYLKKGDRVGYLWEITIRSKNLPEAIEKFRRIFMSCLHGALDFDRQAPTHQEQARGDRLVKTSRAARRKISKQAAKEPREGRIRGGKLPKDYDGRSFSGKLPTQDGQLAAGFQEREVRRVEPIGRFRSSPKPLKVHLLPDNTRVTLSNKD